MKELVNVLAKALVDNPDKVSVEVNEGPKEVTLSLSVDPSDMGRVIGKHGRIAKAMRTVVKAAAAKEGKKVNVEIL